MLLSVKPDQVITGMLLAQDIETGEGNLVLPMDKSLSDKEIRYLRENYNGNELLILEPRLSDRNSLELTDEDIRYGITCALLNEFDMTHTYKLLNVVYAHIGGLFTKIYPQLLDLRKLDPVTFKHCVNVTWICMYLSKMSSLSLSDSNLLLQASLLHDIGKSFIPQSILSKPGSLTTDEYNIIKRHSEYGASWLESLVPRTITEYIRSHHEYLNGTGYPDGKDTTSINFVAHIITVADIFDALMQKRVYKEGASPFQAYQVLLAEAECGKISYMYVVLLRNVLDYLIGKEIVILNGISGKFVGINCLKYANVMVRDVTVKVKMTGITTVL